MENQKKKIIILTSIAIAIFIIAIILTILLVSMNKKDENENIEINNVNEISNVIQENVIENEEINNEIDNTVNEVVPEENEEIVEEEIAKNEPIADPEQEVDKETMDKIESNEEKAINIAKKHYGETSSVYFSFEGIQNGKYKVSVRDSATTRTIREYYINIETGKFDILQ